MTQLTDNTTLDGAPDWSPDGEWIAYTFNGVQKEDREVCVISIDGTGFKRLTDNTSADGEAKWSPNGTQIAFYSMRDGNYNVYN